MDDGTNKSPGRFKLGRQSSKAAERRHSVDDIGSEEELDTSVSLMYLANDGDLDGIKELLDSGSDVNFRDIDNRTALHVAACQGLTDIVELLILRGAEVEPKDRWGSTPLADAKYYKNRDVVKILEKHGAKHPPVAPMHVQNVREVPEYEISPSELDFTNSVRITKGTFRDALWRGTHVAVKTLGEEVLIDDSKLKAFRDELTLLQKVRHPNVVQFLGAVTQTTPMMIVTEYLARGDLSAYLKRRGALKLTVALKFALDIARGMNYLHEHKPEAIIHRDLEPSNILRDDSGHLKVADFGVSKLIEVAKTVKEDTPVTSDTSWRYAAPEVYKNEEYDTKVDVFSFGLILQEMIEGCPPFPPMSEEEIPKAYVANQRPQFKASSRFYAHGLKELIEECWDKDPHRRPTFGQIITRLERIRNRLASERHWEDCAFTCFSNMKALFQRNQTNPGNSVAID